ncbi:hydroxyethylthiazole kinase [Psychrobacillus sp.]|uniref:hydroxyethylthiazole kinase n=1 Tax=Psychrobacillus sp. TaxID=1871623 RepID=UPI0028BD3ECE|nr:hydroxyethylthiazole kinase [Psychrobacillus sp.]
MSLQKINLQKPLVHCITNYVVANFTANGLLAIGASPVMADAVEEAAEMASKSNALLLNIGTLNTRTVEAMKLAGRIANEKNIAVVLDPVGAGATNFRLQATMDLLQQLKINLIRCNVGELAAIAGVSWLAKGVDSGVGELDVAETAMQVANKYNCLVIVTGVQDVITDGNRLEWIVGGHEKVTKMTGSGCLLSALCAAELASCENAFEDLTNLLRDYKQVSLNAYSTIGTFHVNFLNQLEYLAEGHQ